MAELRYEQLVVEINIIYHSRHSQYKLHHNIIIFNLIQVDNQDILQVLQ